MNLNFDSKIRLTQKLWKISMVSNQRWKNYYKSERLWIFFDFVLFAKNVSRLLVGLFLPIFTAESSANVFLWWFCAGWSNSSYELSNRFFLNQLRLIKKKIFLPSTNKQIRKFLSLMSTWYVKPKKRNKTSVHMMHTSMSLQ